MEKCINDVHSNLGEIFPLAEKMNQTMCRDKYTQQDRIVATKGFGQIYAATACMWDALVGSCSYYVKKQMSYSYWQFAGAI